jgi:DNA-binding response OmpR family regulator
MRILIVEDEHRIANTIKKGLEQENYAVDVAYDGTEGFDLAISEEYDAIILDLMLPGMDGITICKQLRDKKNHTPILMLTAKSQTSDKITGLDSGADDYLAKPFSFDELVARIRALTRRPKQVLPAKFEVEDLSLDPSNFLVQRGAKKISLSSKEFALLEYLMRNAHKILSKDQIIGHIWNYEADILPNTVEVYIRNLRNKLGKPEIIQTVRGFGYRIGD